MLANYDNTVYEGKLGVWKQGFDGGDKAYGYGKGWVCCSFSVMCGDADNGCGWKMMLMCVMLEN